MPATLHVQQAWACRGNACLGPSKGNTDSAEKPEAMQEEGRAGRAARVGVQSLTPAAEQGGAEASMLQGPHSG